MHGQRRFSARWLLHSCRVYLGRISSIVTNGRPPWADMMRKLCIKTSYQEKATPGYCPINTKSFLKWPFLVFSFTLRLRSRYAQGERSECTPLWVGPAPTVRPERNRGAVKSKDEQGGRSIGIHFLKIIKRGGNHFPFLNTGITYLAKRSSEGMTYLWGIPPCAISRIK
jgi:hypothetical protein